MKVVSAAMREQRRARRSAERDRRGVAPRVRLGPRPSALIRGGWSPRPEVGPPASVGPRLVGAAATGVLIAPRARVAIGERPVTTGVLPLPPVTVGPLPANPAPGLGLGIAPLAPHTPPAATALTEPAEAVAIEPAAVEASAVEASAVEPTAVEPTAVASEAGAAAAPTPVPAASGTPASSAEEPPRPAPVAEPDAPVVAAAVALTGAPPAAPATT
ncbi:hypothetical protein ACXR2U_24035, partial [Jatrophihabitans sp. YIM 134969]